MWNKGKHIVEDINGKRCSIIEAGVSEIRMQFLKSLLERNKYEVVTEKNPNELYKIGVTDLLFNPVIDVYERRLYTETGEIVSYEHWFQLSN